MAFNAAGSKFKKDSKQFNFRHLIWDSGFFNLQSLRARGLSEPEAAFHIGRHLFSKVLDSAFRIPHSAIEYANFSMDDTSITINIILRSWLKNGSNLNCASRRGNFVSDCALASAHHRPVRRVGVLDYKIQSAATQWLNDPITPCLR